MNEVKLLGKVKIGNLEFNGIEGGFGEDKKAILVKDIAIIHNKKLYHINELINGNRDRFKNNIDIIDLLGIVQSDTELKNYGFTQQAINSYRGKGNGIYILSERGYLKLIKLLEDELAWDIYDMIVDEYFNMRKVLNELSLADRLLLNIIKSKDDISKANAIQEYQTQIVIPLQIENAKQKKEIEYKTDVIYGLTENISLFEKRQLLNRVVRHKGADYRKRWNELYQTFKDTYHIDLKVRCENYNKINRPKMKSVVDYAENFGYIDKLYDIACKLFEGDMNELLEEFGRVISHGEN